MEGKCAEELYLDHLKFRADHHDVNIREIMNRELPNVKAPAPRPMRAHTFDFNLSYHGTHLLGGECKATQSEHEKAMLVFHSLDQLAFKNEALALLTMNNSFTFYTSWLVDGAGYIQMTYHELKKFKLGPVSNINIDPGKNEKHLQLPPTFSMDRSEFEETDKSILKVWGKLRSEVRECMGIILYAVDILYDTVSSMNIVQIGQKCKDAYTSGWEEPNFTATNISDLKSRQPIKNQEDYVYCRKTIEGEDTAEHEARVNCQLYKGFKDILDSDVEMSPEMCAVVGFSMECHKPPNV